MDCITIVCTFAIQNKIMKITIELTEAEVKGLKAYLKEVSDIPNPTQKDIKEQFDWKGWIHAPQESVSHYIKQFENEY